MKIGVLGSGNVGQVLSVGFTKHGHQVTMGTRDPNAEDVRKWASQNSGVSVGSYAGAVRFGDLLVLAVPGKVVDKVIDGVGAKNFAGKTVIDCANPVADAPPQNGVVQYITGPNESLAERTQKQIPDARVVKAFNSVGAAFMVNPHFEQGTPTMFFCGNDDGAKSQVAGIIRQFGWEPYDCGSITSARAIEPLCMLWLVPGLLRNQWTHAFKLLTK
jgi:8-hydroxy-5-deazaflavin:NADPH oxidoreductase